MCGVIAAFGEIDDHVVERMIRALRHRGPDGSGITVGPGPVIGATRLAIIDRAGGRQPMNGPSGDVSVSFNGELYNDGELRRELSTTANACTTRSDTQVLLNWYLEHGLAGLAALDGMYAFAIRDGDRLIVARDRLGIKPLYSAWSTDSRALMFASEVKALLASGRIGTDLDERALADWLLIGHPGGDRTFVRTVRSVPPGALEVYEHVNGTVVPRHGVAGGSPAPLSSGTNRDPCTEDEIRETLKAAVTRQLQADVDVGILLSGGLDSSVLGALSPYPLSSFTVADTTGSEDAVHAAELARRLKFDHHTAIIDARDYFSHIVSAVMIEEQPSLLGGLPLYFLCRHMAASGFTAALIGEGADELFGGYLGHLGLRDLRRPITPDVLESAGILPSDDALGQWELIQRAGWQGSPDLVFAQYLGQTLARQHLEIVDKYSMANGVELRVPFLDNAVYDAALRLPISSKVRAGEPGKIVLRRILEAELGAHDARRFVQRRKIGFPSSGQRMVSAFSSLCERMLGASYVRRHRFGRLFRNPYVLLMTELFEDVFLRSDGEWPSGFDLGDYLRAAAGRHR